MIKHPLIALTCGLSLTLISLAASPSQAQEEEKIQKNESSTLYGNNEGFNAYEMIHRMRMGNQDPESFRRSTNSSIDNAAANYRNQLLQYWQQQKQNTTPTEVTTPAVETAPTETME